MTTKYILHGGFVPGQPPENDRFYQEILKDTPNTVKILLVYFAKEDHRVAANKVEDIKQFSKNKQSFSSNKEEKTLLFEVADENLFPQQVARADVIYLHGGRTAKIVNALKKFTDLKTMFQGKTIAGDSAGANALATICYSKSGGGVMKGLGLLPIRLFPHYTQGDEKKLGEGPEDWETVLLPAYQYRVYETAG